MGERELGEMKMKEIKKGREEGTKEGRNRRKERAKKRSAVT